MRRLFLIAFLPLVSSCTQAQNLQQIKKELTDLYDEDQLIRQEYMAAIQHPTPTLKIIDSLGKIMEKIDSLNIIRVSAILDSYGWIGKDKIGETANSTLFLVVQHSDLKTQQKYLPMLRKAVLADDASKKDLALMEDRVAIREGKMQIYGSQIGQSPGSTEFYVFPLIDPENVDARRAEMGLEPMGDYVKRWKMIWDPKEYIRQLPKIKEMNKRN